MAKYKKILLITLDFYPNIGGIAEYYFNLSHFTNKLYPDKISVLAPKINSEFRRDQKVKKLNFKIYRKNLLFRLPVWPRWLPMFWHIYYVKIARKIDILWAGEILPTGTVLYFLSRWFNIDYIVSCHGMDILQLENSGYKKKLALRILDQAIKITVNSNYTRSLLLEWGIKTEKIAVVYPGINSSLFKPEYKNSNYNSFDRKSLPQIVDNILKLIEQKTKDGGKPPVMLSLCRLVARKGIDNVIQSLPQVWSRFPELIYIIAGDGPDYNRLHELSYKIKSDFFKTNSDKNKQKPNIIFTKAIGQDSKNVLLSCCDFFVMPARATKTDVEGFGIVYLEAALYSKPSIAGNSGGAGEAVLDLNTGLIVDPNNINYIATAIIKLIQDDSLRCKLGSEARKRALKQFLWENSVDEFLKLF